MKKCQFCGAELPDEASFCLQCSSVLNCREESNTKKSKVFYIKYKKVFAFCLAIFFIFTISIISVYRIKKLPLKPQNTNAPETVLVPVTEENGETVTDSQGDTVYDIVTVEPTTKKPSFISEIINSIKDKDENKDKDKDKNDNKNDNKVSNSDTTDSSGSDISRNPTSTENDTNSSSEEPSTDNSNVTAPTQSQVPTETEPTTDADTTSSIDDFEFTELNGKIKITKYTGSASTVTVPAYIDGKRVAYLGENAFANNSSIKKIVFEGATSGTDKFYLPYDTIVFYNLPNLTSVTFPYETNNFMVKSDGEQSSRFSFHKLFTQCKKLSSVSISERINPNYKPHYIMYSADGAVFTQTDSNIRCSMVYYPPGKTTANYIIPEDVFDIAGNAFYNNPYIKTVTITKNTKYLGSFIGCTNLQSYIVAEDHPTMFSENGVIYTSGLLINDVRYHGVKYPPGKTDTTFEFTSKVYIMLAGSEFCGNPYIQTAKFPSALFIQRSAATNEYSPPSLKTFYINKEMGDANMIWAKEYYTFIYY